MLGWKILDEGEYDVRLPRLSEEEEQVISLVEERFREEARESEFSSDRDVSGLLRQLLIEYSEAEGIILDHDQLEYLSEMARLHIYGFAFIEPLLSDSSIEEVSVIGLGRPAYVFVRGEGWKQVNAMFTDERALMDVVNKMARHLGRRITLQKPKLNTILKDGSRLHATLPPLSQGELTLRKFSEEPFSPNDLVSLKTMPARALAALSFIMQADMSLVVAGNTASGKTTTLNMLFSFIPRNERVVLAEESPEINIPHAHKVRLVANEEMGISLKDLVYDTLRMRPDRFVVGEVRNRPETEALFDSLLGGQARGCYATFHAQSVEETFRRFSLFGINEIDFNSINAVLVQRRMLRYDPRSRKNTEMRRVTELCFGPTRNKPLFRYLPEKDSWEEGDMGTFSESVCASLGISRSEFRQQFSQREKFLRKKLDFSEFFDSFQEKFYGV
ncbi:MAG: ATPase, T2SS/T4P/T4SS family [Candidatus Micrarchaeia archaeon]